MHIDQKTLLKQKLDEIYSVTKQRHHEVQQLGVLSGLSGMALFAYAYGWYTQKEEPAEFGEDLLTTCITKINEGNEMATYCTGIAGVGWVLDHLVEHDLIELDNDALFSGIDPFLFEHLKGHMANGHYDFLHGGTGFAFYFLKRYRNTRQSELKDRYQQYLLHYLEQLAQLAQKEGTSLKWESVLQQETGERGFNLSLSHGMSSLINFLARLHPHAPFQAKATPLLQGAVAYMLASEHTDTTECMFPSWRKAEGSDKQAPSRVAWCYGDPGIGISLWYAGKALNDEALQQKAQQILLHSAPRTSPKASGVKDAGVCHGAYGNAQLFSRMHREMGLPPLATATNYWLEQGLAMATHANGYAGYSQFRPIKEGTMGWEPALAPLEGITGIGLAIIDYLAEADLHWDECLLVG